ncbi:DUF2249 domain-containing protein [bacterium]|nr:MAG: DUF2249 domain-containing protein [bacterium]
MAVRTRPRLSQHVLVGVRRQGSRRLASRHQEDHGSGRARRGLIGVEPKVLDVRPYHERGEEPYQAIMDAVDSLAAGQSLLLINTFEPTPLYRVMDRKGFDHECTRVTDGEFHIRFAPRS